MIFRYSDVIKPRLDIALYERDKLTKKESFFPSGSFSPSEVNELAKEITNAFEAAENFDLVISSQSTLKEAADIPPMGKSWAKEMIEKQFAEEYPRREEKYFFFPVDYAHSSGYAFDYYFVKRDIVEGFKRLATALGVQCLSYNTSARYFLCNIGKSEPLSALFYLDGTATFFCAAKGRVLSAIDMPYGEKEFFRTRTLIESECEMRCRQIKFKRFYLCSDKELNLYGTLLPANFSVYKNNGIIL